MSSLSTAVPAEVIEAVPFERYCEWDEVHATSLWAMVTSPLLYDSRKRAQKEETDSMRAGRAAHTAVLEPDRFMRDYALWPADSGRRYGKKWDEFCASNVRRTVITEEQYDRALRMRDVVRNHKVAGKYLAEKGRSELTLKWTHPRTGVRCKARIDWLCSAIIDLKSARDVSPVKMSTAAARYGYVFQQAFYGDGVAAALDLALPQKLIAVQSSEPFDVVVYDLPEDELQKGREQYEAAIDKLIECQTSGVWPGLAPDEEVTLRLPAWAASPEAEEEQLTVNGEALF